MMDKWHKAEYYACYKYYSVSYEIEGSYMPRTIKGVLLSLALGKATMLTENGVWIIPLKDIKYMQPSVPKMEIYSKEYQVILRELIGTKEGINEMGKT
jgi:hypothetical protein